MNTEFDFDGGYGRKGKAYAAKQMVCLKCAAITTCLIVDSSDGEYEPGSFCQPCLTRLFEDPFVQGGVKWA